MLRFYFHASEESGFACSSAIVYADHTAVEEELHKRQQPCAAVLRAEISGASRELYPL